ncbi:ring finger domain-containing protein [Curvularia clavata]|uniref:RBR-type E3 ubiquitin transferase n=1 Tax=Curvularia clavata TaxID=95742 RepID=A0A9Q9DUC6_CURCL|nr:ring finger domain-containing protein [Curvularia clavata]
MGSRLSRAAAPCKPDASAVVPAYRDTQHTNTSSNRQGSAPRLSQDDIVVNSSTILPTDLRRRNSAPAPISATVATPGTIKNEQELTATFDFFYAARRLMSICLPDGEPEVPAVAPVLSIPTDQQLSKPQERQLHCVICITPLPDEKGLHFMKHVIQPCWECDSSFCPSCIKSMFVDACRDMTRMPPRCCVPINLSHARPHLTQDEIQLFKSKYDEWLTPSPFYCPVATCSVFIPERLLPGRTNTNGKRIDSGTGTPTSKTFACPTCEASICLDCRQLAHPSSPCNVSEFGLDQETTRLLKRWGYKQCPKCRHGLRRMHGCNHMECRCGAHFCYICMGDPNNCGGDCHRSDDEDGEYDEDDGESLSGSDENPVQEETRQTVTHETPPASSRNLDGGGSSYWIDQDLDFGEDPGELVADPFWNCSHAFTPYKIDLAQALTRDASDVAMECVKCWRTTYPEIRLANVHRRAGGQMAGRHGAALRRNSTPGCPISHRVPLLDPLLIDCNDPPTKQLRDLYGNVVYPAEPAHHHQRRASIHDLTAASTSQDIIPKSSLLTESASSTPNSPEISLANECMDCRLLVCDSCKDDLMAAQGNEA